MMTISTPYRLCETGIVMTDTPKRRPVLLNLRFVTLVGITLVVQVDSSQTLK